MPPVIVPPRNCIEPVAAENVSVLAVLVNVPVRLRLPPATLSNVPSAALLKVPPRLTVLAESTTLMVPALLQRPPGPMVRMPPLRASSVPVLLSVPLLLMVSVPALMLALMVPALARLLVPPAKIADPKLPRPCTTAPEPSVSVPPASSERFPFCVALPRLMVALLKLCVPVKPTTAALAPATVPTFITPGEPPASVCSTRPLLMRTRPDVLTASPTVITPRIVRLSSVPLLPVKTRPLAPVC